MFEGVFMLNLPNEEVENELFSRLLSVPGLKSVEIIQDEE
jgi:hypothetical protein